MHQEYSHQGAITGLHCHRLTFVQGQHSRPEAPPEPGIILAGLEHVPPPAAVIIQGRSHASTRKTPSRRWAGLGLEPLNKKRDENETENECYALK